MHLKSLFCEGLCRLPDSQRGLKFKKFKNLSLGESYLPGGRRTGIWEVDSVHISQMTLKILIFYLK